MTRLRRLWHAFTDRRDLPVPVIVAALASGAFLGLAILLAIVGVMSTGDVISPRGVWPVE